MLPSARPSKGTAFIHRRRPWRRWSAPSSVSAASWPSATLSNAGESFHRPWHRVWGTWKALEDVAVVDFDVVGLEETASDVRPSAREREREKNERERQSQHAQQTSKQRATAAGLPRSSPLRLESKPPPRCEPFLHLALGIINVGSSALSTSQIQWQIKEETTHFKGKMRPLFAPSPAVCFRRHPPPRLGSTATERETPALCR